MDPLLLRPLLPHTAAASADVAAVLAAAVWEPSAEKLRQTMETYEQCPDHRLYIRLGGGPEPEVAAVIGLRERAGTVEIRHLAVAPDWRGRGLGREMIFALPTVLACPEVLAETDREAVGFYKRLGFHVESLGELYPGTERFRCRLRLPEAVRREAPPWGRPWGLSMAAGLDRPRAEMVSLRWPLRTSRRRHSGGP